MPLPFEVPFEEVCAKLETYVDEVFLSLQSQFMMLPKGPGFARKWEQPPGRSEAPE
jgi:hypothetical protein